MLNAAVTATAVLTCGVTTAPQIAVTLACPAVTATAGGTGRAASGVRNAAATPRRSDFTRERPKP